MNSETATFHQTVGYLNLTSNSYNTTDTLEFNSSSSYFALNPRSFAARNLTSYGFLYDWNNPCNPRNISKELHTFSLPFPGILLRVKVDLDVSCELSTVIKNIADSVFELADHSVIGLAGVYILGNYTFTGQFDALFAQEHVSANGNKYGYGLPTYTTPAVPKFGQIPPDSLGSILEKSSTLKLSDIKSPIIYQTMLISGMLPESHDTDSPNSNNPWLGIIGVAAMVLVLILVLVGGVCFWRKRRSTILQQPMELNHIPAVNPKPVPVLESKDLEKIPCVKYDPDASAKAVSDLRKTSYPSSGAIAAESDSTCSVCLEPFKLGDDIRKLPSCEHCFHKHCIDGWLLEQSCCCPNCRFDLRVALGIEITETKVDVADDVVQVNENQVVNVDTEINRETEKVGL